MSTKAIIATIVVVVVVLGGGYYLMTRSSQPADTIDNDADGMMQDEAMPTDAMMNGSDTMTEQAPQGDTMMEDNMMASESPSVESSETTAPEAVTISYTDAGFSPQNVTVKKGTTVTWVNNSSANMWVASAVHPTHTKYDGTTLQQHCGTATAEAPFDECKGEPAGTQYSFTFDKVGQWAFHDHLNAQHFGSVTVTE